MYELQQFLTKLFQNIINWFTNAFTTVAVYFLVAVIAIIVIMVFILIIKAMINRAGHREK